jgi:hypothetical protein
MVSICLRRQRLASSRGNDVVGYRCPQVACLSDEAQPGTAPSGYLEFSLLGRELDLPAELGTSFFGTAISQNCR